MSTTKTSTDEFTGRTMTQMTFNPLAGANLIDDSQVRLEAMKSIEPSGEVLYVLAVNLAGNGGGWCFIEAGESLLFVVDGQAHALVGDGSSDAREADGGNTFETSIYPTTPEFLRLLANAQEVKVRVVGSRRSIDRKFGDANTKNFQEFVAAHVGA